MHSRWNDAEAAALVAASATAPPELMLRVYTSRLPGAERSLVLHGGGNTSVKTQLADLHGTLEDVLLVKSSGSDLASMEASDFCTVRLDPVRRLAQLADLDNAALSAAVSTALARPSPHKPSIETLLHALLPWKFVEHTHADAILALTNTSNGAAIAREVFADLAPLVSFRASGFVLALAPRGGRVVAVGAQSDARGERIRRRAASAQIHAVCVALAEPSALAPARARLIAELCTSECARCTTSISLVAAP